MVKLRIGRGKRRKTKGRRKENWFTVTLSEAINWSASDLRGGIGRNCS
jgi:hypothetical protein